jgi:putative oxidoreductase
MELRLYVDKPPSRSDLFKKWLLRAGVALLFISVGSNKFAAHSPWIQIFAQLGFGQWFRYFTGVLQIGGGVLVLIPRTFALGIVILACTMAGAMASWIFLLGAPLNAMIPGALLLGLLFVGGEDLIELGSSIRMWRHD